MLKTLWTSFRKNITFNNIKKVFNSNLGAGMVSAYFGYFFAKSYREEELKDLKNDVQHSNEDMIALKTQIREVDSVNRRTLNELAIARSQLDDCRFNFSSSWCLFRRNSRFPVERDKKNDEKESKGSINSK